MVALVEPNSAFAESHNERSYVVRNDRELRLSVDETVLVRLPVQLGTGYSWSILRTQEFCSIIEKPTEGENSNPGAEEFQVFRVKAKRAGKGEISFLLSRPFQRDRKTDRIIHLSLVTE